MKKKARHLRFIPKAKGWSVCRKCGEAKLPHRICNKYMEVCAMSDEEFTEKRLSIKKEEKSASE